MKKKLLLTVALVTLFNGLMAQDSIQIGQTHKIFSKGLNQEIELQIYTPSGYSADSANYPTLYVLDGQWYFINGVAIQESLRGDRIMPKMIVVGINMVDRPYRSRLFDQWDALIECLESEVVSYIDENFRTRDRRIIFGWENSSYLASELLLRKNSPFNCAIAVSGGNINKDSLSRFTSENERYLFIAGSEKDIYSIDYTNATAEVLRSVNPVDLTWDYRLFNDEEHESLAYASMYQGLKFFYHNYGSLVFSSTDEFYERGGISYLNQYFQRRGERFGISTAIDASTKNSLIWLAWKRDNFVAFDLFMSEFEGVLSTRRYANAYWQNRLAQYYLKNNAFDKAITFFEKGITDYADERYMAEMHAGLGMSFKGKGEMKLARKHLKKAVEIAVNAGDLKEETYRAQLNDLKQ